MTADLALAIHSPPPVGMNANAELHGSGVRESEPLTRSGPGGPAAVETLMPNPKREETTVTVQPLRRSEVTLRIIGTQPLFQNRMANKVKEYLLVGGGKKTAAERKEIKHHPLDEYRNSAEILTAGPTALGLRVVAVKAAMCTAALETKGLTKTGVQRLIFMPGDFFALYGTPQLRMDVVRSADIAKTPDIRSRCYLPQWGAEVKIQFIVPQLSVSSVVSLLCNAGVLIGVGDYRQEKGKGSFGTFRVIGEGEDDAEWNDLVKNHGRVSQNPALADPEYADRDTSDLMQFWNEETQRRLSEVGNMTVKKAKSKVVA